MKFAEKLILSFGVKFLRRYEYNSNLELKVEGSDLSYQDYAPQIKRLYDKAAYWHGTGRYRYECAGKSKYNGVNKSERLDILQSIIDHGGLIAHYDVMGKINRVEVETISLGQYRICSRLFAGYHQHEKRPIRYEYGSSRFWQSYLEALLFFSRTGNIFIRAINHLIWCYSKEVQRMLDVWMSAIRSDLEIKTITSLSIYRLTSDIPDNYGILIGIPKHAVNIDYYNVGCGRFEVRTSKPVTLKDFTHIEVPLFSVKETEELLKRNNVNLKVIPLEFGEIYCNSLTLEQLSFA